MAALLILAAQVAGAQAEPGGEVRSTPAHAAVDALRIAILPVENLSGVSAPLPEIEHLLMEEGRQGGFALVAAPSLATFMKNHRLRYTGGVSRATAKAAREEMGVDAILVTSLETFREGAPPRVTLHGRLVATEENLTVLWADSVGMAGDEAPGLLGLGLITDPDVLLGNAVHDLMGSLREASREWAGAAEGGASRGTVEERRGTRLGKGSPLWPRRSPRRDVAVRYAARFQPRTQFRSSALDWNAHHTVAVIPFLNVGERKYADKLLALHFVAELQRHANLTVVEPGLVRERLLTTRAIMAGGPSTAVADLFFHQEFPAVDLILSGQVFDYQDRERVPKADFSVQVFEKTTRQVVWFSRSYNRGDEDVLFFDIHRQYTANTLITRMARSAIDRMLR